MNRAVVRLVLLSLFAASCVSPVDIDRDIRVSVDEARITTPQQLVSVAVRVHNATSRGITPVRCGTERLERSAAPGQFVPVSVELECAAGPPVVQWEIAPHSEAALILQIPVTAELSSAAEYRVSIPVFIEGESNSRVLRSATFAFVGLEGSTR